MQFLTLRLYLHHAQEICCQPRQSSAHKRQQLRTLSRQAQSVSLTVATLPRTEQVFWWTLTHLPLLLPLLCQLKRRLDLAKRKFRHQS